MIVLYLPAVRVSIFWQSDVKGKKPRLNIHPLRKGQRFNLCVHFYEAIPINRPTVLH